MKSFGVTSVLLLTLVLASPSAGEAQVLRLQPSELCSDHSGAAIATFEDANLEARVRAALSLGAQDDLTCGMVSGLRVLDALVSAGFRGRGTRDIQIGKSISGHLKAFHASPSAEEPHFNTFSTT